MTNPGDFGLAAAFKMKSTFESRKFVGKQNYWSPEITKQKSFNAKSNDVWCLGVCLFMLIIGSFPFSKSCESQESFVAIMEGNILNVLKEWKKIRYVDDALVELFELLFQFEENRASIEEIKQSSWLYDGGR